MSTPAPKNANVPLLHDTQGLEVLPYSECVTLLQRNEVGRIGFAEAGETTILPVNYGFLSGSVVFRSAGGAKHHAAMLERPMSLEIDGWDAGTRTGWSVLVKGTTSPAEASWLTTVEDLQDIAPWADAVSRNNWIRLRADDITGRRIVARTTPS